MQVLALVGAYLFLLLCVIITGFMVSLLVKWVKHGRQGTSNVKLKSTSGMSHKEKKNYNREINAQIRENESKKRQFLLSGLKKKKSNNVVEGEGDETSK